MINLYVTCDINHNDEDNASLLLFMKQMVLVSNHPACCEYTMCHMMMLYLYTTYQELCWLCMLCSRSYFAHLSGFLYCHWGNHMIVPVPRKQPCLIWVNWLHGYTDIYIYISTTNLCHHVVMIIYTYICMLCMVPGHQQPPWWCSLLYAYHGCPILHQDISYHYVYQGCCKVMLFPCSYPGPGVTLPPKDQSWWPLWPQWPWLFTCWQLIPQTCRKCTITQNIQIKASWSLLPRYWAPIQYKDAVLHV